MLLEKEHDNFNSENQLRLQCEKLLEETKELHQKTSQDVTHQRKQGTLFIINICMFVKFHPNVILAQWLNQEEPHLSILSSLHVVVWIAQLVSLCDSMLLLVSVKTKDM